MKTEISIKNLLLLVVSQVGLESNIYLVNNDKIIFWDNKYLSDDTLALICTKLKIIVPNMVCNIVTNPNKTKAIEVSIPKKLD